MEDRKCEICESIFPPVSPSHQYCCDVCRKKSTAIRSREWARVNANYDTREYTDSEIEFIKSNQGLLLDNIAVLMGRRKRSVNRTANGLGIKLIGLCSVCEKEFHSPDNVFKCSSCKNHRHKKFKQTQRGRYAAYKNNARQNAREFSLSFVEFLEFWNKPCSYCGDSIDGVGIDRIDSGSGYRNGNITPCCSTCNTMKMDLPKDIWINHIKKIISHLDKD